MKQQWKVLRACNIRALIAALSERHPELGHRVTMRDVMAMAKREEIWVQICALSRPARLGRFSGRVVLQLSDRLPRRMRPFYAMHELCHFWRDDPGEPCYHRDNYEEIVNPDEVIADVFAVAVTMPPGDRELFDYKTRPPQAPGPRRPQRKHV